MHKRRPNQRVAKSLRLSEDCLKLLEHLADDIGKRHPMTLAAEILEQFAQIHPENYFLALDSLRKLRETKPDDHPNDP